MSTDQKDDASSKKRRRTEITQAKTTAKSDAKAKGKAKVEQRKQIVRIRAKVHCTAAGLPGLDAPLQIKKGKDAKGDHAGNLPDWHPLQKVGYNHHLMSQSVG